jgi:hypothetical protein
MMRFMNEHEDKLPLAGFVEKVLGKARVEQLRRGVEALLDGPQPAPGRTVEETWRRGSGCSRPRLP